MTSSNSEANKTILISNHKSAVGQGCLNCEQACTYSVFEGNSRELSLSLHIACYSTSLQHTYISLLLPILVAIAPPDFSFFTFFSFFLIIRPPPRSTLFPFPPLFFFF